MKELRRSGILFFLLVSLNFSAFTQLTQGFVDEKVPGPWGYIVGFAFDEVGGMYAWERAGKVYLVEDDKKGDNPVIDISEEVGFFGDHGMLSMVLHPNFLNNGYLYVLYAVDRHHLMNFGTANYDPLTSATHEASIGRVTRYTLSKADSFRSVVPGSRYVLIGATIDDGLALLHTSHGVGDLLFGNDGSLLISCGDASTYKSDFIGGGEEGTYAAQALEDGIIRPKEDVGSYRSQLIDSHNGKVLRIHPETGEGLSSNPFFDPQAPAAPRSRVWALGFRNPFRMNLLPGTGGHAMEEGDPGTIYVSDVGSAKWEEINIITEPGQNFGWPIWEGFEGNWGFSNKPAYNQDAANPLYNPGECEHPFFRFHDLIIKATETSFPFWGNPCRNSLEIPFSLHRFIHKRPALAYNNLLWNSPTRAMVGIFDDEGKPRSVSVTEAPWGYEGNVFDGICTIGGQFYQGDNFPAEYQNRYFVGDFNGWLNILDFDSLGRVTKMEPFHDGVGSIVHLDVHPTNGCLYYVKYKDKELHKICYGVDPAPIINLNVDRNFGSSPLTVQFDASNSKDPEGQPITFHWDFGNGETRTNASPNFTFSTENNDPTAFPVMLTVTDTAGKRSTREVVISVNNTPPKVFISSVAEGSNYAVNGLNLVPLDAEVSDLEHAGSQLRYEWQTFLLHNNHLHPEPIDTNKITQTLLDPAGCAGEYYAYRIALTVYDEAGLFGNHEITLFPNCDGFPVEFQLLNASFENEKVTLDWETLSEDSVLRYEIEKAPDRLHFEKMGSLDAQGTTQSLSTYQFIDNQPIIGLNVYRLKVLTANGRYHYSSPVEIETFKGIGIQVYPNPTVNILAFQFREMKEAASFELFELNGKKVLHFDWTGTGKSFRQISVSQIQPAMYFYRLRNGVDMMEGKLVIVR